MKMKNIGEFRRCRIIEKICRFYISIIIKKYISCFYDKSFIATKKIAITSNKNPTKSTSLSIRPSYRHGLIVLNTFTTTKILNNIRIQKRYSSSNSNSNKKFKSDSDQEEEDFINSASRIIFESMFNYNNNKFKRFHKNFHKILQKEANNLLANSDLTKFQNYLNELGDKNKGSSHFTKDDPYKTTIKFEHLNKAMREIYKRHNNSFISQIITDNKHWSVEDQRSRLKLESYAGSIIKKKQHKQEKNIITLSQFKIDQDVVDNLKQKQESSSKSNSFTPQSKIDELQEEIQTKFDFMENQIKTWPYPPDGFKNAKSENGEVIWVDRLDSSKRIKLQEIPDQEPFNIEKPINNQSLEYNDRLMTTYSFKDKDESSDSYNGGFSYKSNDLYSVFFTVYSFISGIINVIQEFFGGSSTGQF